MSSFHSDCSARVKLCPLDATEPPIRRTRTTRSDASETVPTPRATQRQPAWADHVYMQCGWSMEMRRLWSADAGFFAAIVLCCAVQHLLVNTAKVQAATCYLLGVYIVSPGDRVTVLVKTAVELGDVRADLLDALVDLCYPTGHLLLDQSQVSFCTSELGQRCHTTFSTRLGVLWPNCGRGIYGRGCLHCG